MSEPRLGLIVLRASEPTRTRRFYEALGLSFSVEQHGSGALHYACVLGPTVLEIYPGHDARAPVAEHGGATMLGLSVGNVDTAFTAATAAGGASRRAPGDSPHGRRAVLEDPDGRVVELTQT